jgi:lycopene cyclase-like protein
VTDRVDVAVVGEGPAGSALAAACADVGLEVVHLGADLAAPWAPTYGAWVDELRGVLDNLGDAVWARRWPRPVVAFDAGERSLDRPYGLLDKEALHRHLRAVVARSGRLREGRVVRSAHDAAGSRLHLADGGAVEARVVVDATGRGVLLQRPRGRPAAFQVAYGVVGRVVGGTARSPLPGGGMAFMDWRGATGAAPTFLYGMDLGEGRVLLEETSLAARPGLPMPELRRRLQQRLDTTGSRVDPVEATEHVAIPMGGPLPHRPQRVVGFGAAAGMIHPATGFSVAASLRRAPVVAAALHAALAGGADPDQAAAAGWEAVWPRDLLRQRALHTYGLEVLLRLDGAEVQRFFDVFFSLPPEAWHGYLSGAGSSRDLARTMLAVARRLPWSLRRRVAGGVAGRDGIELVRGLR